MSGFWRKCRIAFRCLRFGAWLLVLAVLGAFLWFNRVGLPDFLKTRLVSLLHERGVDLEFSRMRLSLVRGVVAEDVRMGASQTPDSAALGAREVQLQLNFPALWHRQWQLDGLTLRDGYFTLPLSPTNALSLTNLQTELRFGTGDTWSLDRFRAQFAGAQIVISGELAHAPEARHWKLFSGTGTDRSALATALKKFSDTLQLIQFQGEPQVRLAVAGDARDEHTIVLRLETTAAGVRTPWFDARDFQATAHLTAPASAPTNSEPAWGFWTNLQPLRLAWSLQLGELQVETVAVRSLACHGAWAAPELVVSNLSAALGGGQFQTSARLDVATRRLTFTNQSNVDPRSLAAWLPANARKRLAELAWAKPPALRTEGSLRLPAWTNTASANWSDIASSVAVRGELAVTNLTVRGVSVDRLRTRFSYAESVWNLPEVELAQGRTHLKLHGQGNAATKRFQGGFSGQLDAASVRPLVATNQWVDQFAVLTANDPLTLALELGGNWQTLADLTSTGRVVQGRTQLQWSGQGNARTKDFQGTVSGQLDAATVKAFLPAVKEGRGFGLLTFHQPLELTLDVAGNLGALETLNATGRLALADFAVRSETLDQVTAAMTYSNLTAEFFHPRLTRAGGVQHFAAEKVTLDLAGQRLFIHGGAGSLDPMVVGRAIGPKTAAAMAPYEFLATPTAQVNGCIPLRQKDDELVQADADLRADIVGTAHFRWRRFETPAITGRVHWWNHNLILTNVVSECYGGAAHGWATFDLRPEIVGTDFSFDVTGTNVDFHRMAVALWAPTNNLEGLLSGTLSVVRANSSDWRSWNGSGQAQLNDGLLWDIPIFGIISPLLNTISSGLGNSRATEATAKCIITDGVIFSDSLNIRSTLMRLSYHGTVDMQQNVQARATAHLLRDIWVVGPLVSTVLWPVSKVFECEVTGTLDQPKAAPILLPAKLLLVPLHPISSLKEFFFPSAPPAPPSPPATK